MKTLEKIEKEIEQIKIRNKRVEVDKAWEMEINPYYFNKW